MKLCGMAGKTCGNCGGCCKKSGAKKAGAEREYRGDSDGDVSVIAWHEGGHSYVLASRMPVTELVHLAEGLPLAMLPPFDAANAVPLAALP